MSNFNIGDTVYFIDDGSRLYIDRDTVTHGTVSQCDDYTVTMYVEDEEDLRVVPLREVFPTELLALIHLHEYLTERLTALGKGIEFIKTREGSA